MAYCSPTTAAATPTMATVPPSRRAATTASDDAATLTAMTPTARPTHGPSTRTRQQVVVERPGVADRLADDQRRRAPRPDQVVVLGADVERLHEQDAVVTERQPAPRQAPHRGHHDRDVDDGEEGPRQPPRPGPARHALPVVSPGRRRAVDLVDVLLAGVRPVARLRSHAADGSNPARSEEHT